MRWMAIALLCAACDPGTPFEQSCAGEAIVNCRPHEYSIIDSIEVSPSGLEIDDPGIPVSIRIRLSRCAQAPTNHEITMRLRTLSADDAGSGGSLLDLLTLRDDGRTEGDSVAGDGMIDIEVPSPFIGSMIPENQDVALRFVSRALAECDGPGGCVGGTCRSEAFEIPFRTGARSEL